jgi:ribosomal protein S18 acetylase RimI-like enzyme
MRIRLATEVDAAAIVGFNRAMALETEGKDLVPEVIGAGVRALLGNPASGFYVVAEEARRAVGGLMITKEWSDWRNGELWWIQSLYVVPEFRRRGVFRRLYAHVQELASREPRVRGFRLYVERDNAAAQAVYRAIGMHETHYRVYEALNPGVRFYR